MIKWHKKERKEKRKQQTTEQMKTFKRDSFLRL